MKKLLVLAMCSLAIIISCKKSNSGADVHLTSGLLVYLPFNGSMSDSSGNGNTVTAVGGAALTFDEHGKANSAFGGTGNGERVLVTNNGSIKFDRAFSISFDVMSRFPGRYGLVNMVDNTTAAGFSFGVGTNSVNPNNLVFDVSDSSVECGNVAETGNLRGDTVDLVLAPESWYNVIATFNKGVLQTYINGKLISTKTGADPIVPICSSAKMTIGGWWDGDPASINGKLDEVRLYNRVLNADEIASLSKNFQ
jgi:hypothetical protein